MKVIPIFLGLIFTVSAGCGSDTDQGILTSTAQETVDAETTMFAGASFTSAEQVETAQNGLGGTEADSWRVSFTDETVTWTQGEILEVGSYSQIDGTTMLALFADREVAFEADGGNLTWDSISYLRVSQFSSQETLVDFLNGASYKSVDLKPTNTNSDIGVALDGLTYWHADFIDSTITWTYPGATKAGTVEYLDDDTFTIIFPDATYTVVVEADDIIFDGTRYTREIISQFDSQETLVGFLGGTNYKSVYLKPTSVNLDIGVMTDGLTYWFVDFLDNTMTWSHGATSEVGIVEYLDDNNFTAIFPDATYTVSVENDEISFDGTNYSRVTGE